jgi:glycosyltransferase involved in cell wall biosynthesis
MTATSQMIPGAQPDRTLAVYVPLRSASLHYRAYQESLEQGTVLSWIMTTLSASSGPGTRLVCVCPSPNERERVLAALAPSIDADVRCVRAKDETHLCRLVMDRLGVSRLIVAGLCHAVSPPHLISHLWNIHCGLSSELTDVIGSTFAHPLYIVESSLVDELLKVPVPNMPGSVIGRATLARQARQLNSSSSRDFVWLHLDASQRYGMAKEQWPERIALDSPRDVAALRRISGRGESGDTAWSFICAWKQTAIAVSQEQLSIRQSRARSLTTKRRRILFASHMPGFTGAHQSVCNLVAGLDRRRYEPLALVSYTGTFTDELRRRDVQVICPEEDIAGAGVEAFTFARRILARYRPDILHANHGIGMPLICAANAAGVPLVQHVRVPDVEGLKSHLHAAEAVIAVSHFIKARLGAIDISPDRVDVIWNGVDTSHFKPDPLAKPLCRRRLGVPDDAFVVIMIARMARNKRHDTVISALGELRRASGRGHLILVGETDSDQAYHRHVESLLVNERLAEFTSCFDFFADIRQVLYAGDVLVLPSEDEPLSRAALDAMALGLAVVVGDSGGTKELIDPGRTGLVVPCGDHRRLAGALLGLAENPALAAGMGAAAAEKVRTSLTAGQCAAKTCDVYERVLQTMADVSHRKHRYREAKAVWALCDDLLLDSPRGMP